jgi:hypothetical protein
VEEEKSGRGKVWKRKVVEEESGGRVENHYRKATHNTDNADFLPDPTPSRMRGIKTVRPTQYVLAASSNSRPSGMGRRTARGR